MKILLIYFQKLFTGKYFLHDIFSKKPVSPWNTYFLVLGFTFFFSAVLAVASSIFGKHSRKVDFGCLHSACCSAIFRWVHINCWQHTVHTMLIADWLAESWVLPSFENFSALFLASSRFLLASQPFDRPMIFFLAKYLYTLSNTIFPFVLSSRF